MIHQQFDRAIRTVRGIVPLCLAALTALATACSSVERELIDKDLVPLTFYVQAAQPQPTRAYVGDLPAENGENAIRTIKVWLFDDDATCVGYTEDLSSDRVTMRVTMMVPQSIVSKGKVDVYVIANPASVGLTTLDGNTTQVVLKQTILQGTNFTAASPTTAVPGDGLPMSRIVKACTIQTDGPTPTLPEIKLTRAVSKIRFAFAKAYSHAGEVLGIELQGSQIAPSERIFPVEPTEANAADYTAPYQGDLRANIDGTSYEANKLTLGSTDGSAVLVPTTSIEALEDPSDLTWAKNTEKTAEAYNQLIDKYVGQTLYLRESDKQIWGTIYYRLSPSGDVKHQDFSMIASSDVQDFARNHVWIVYGYFLGNKFNLIVQTIPWEDSYITMDYTETPSWKDDGRPRWMPTLTGSNSRTETIDGVDFTTILCNGGDTPSCAFTLDAPVGWEWMAVLEPLTEGAGEFISFADGTSVAKGSVGQVSVLTFKVSETTTTVTHRARLRLYVRTTSGDQSREVQEVKFILSRNI